MNFFSNRTAGFIQLCFVIGFIVLSVFISWALQSQQTNPTGGNGETQNRPIYVETEIINQGPYRVTYETTGTVQAMTVIGVVPEVSGRVTSVNDNFYEGGLFKAGETLFTIDRRDFELAVERQQAQVASAQTALQLQQAEAEAALAEWRMRNGKKEAPDLVARKPQLQQAQADLNAAIAQLMDAQLDLERALFSFPFDGRVLSSDIAAGRYVSIGQAYGEVYDINALEIRSSIAPDRLDWLLNTNDLDIKAIIAQNGQTRIYDAVVNRGASSFNADTRFASVSFGFANTQNVLPGQFATIRVTGPELNDISQIPSSALQKNDVIWAVDTNNQLTRVNPDIIATTDDVIAVRGLPDNTRIVTSRINGGAEGMEISNGTQGEKAE